MTDLEYFKAALALRDEDLLLVPIGSRVYGTAGPDSDEDYLAIVPAGRRAISGRQFCRGRLDLQVVNAHEFQERLDFHEVIALEAYFLPGGECRERFTFKLDREKLRHEWLRKSSHSWVRAKKKFDTENDPKAGRKSLFHALRIAAFARQVAGSGRIADYAAANGWWAEIDAMPEEDWATYKERYQALHNRLCSEVRLATR